MLTRFLIFNPPSFNGEPDDRKAESWLFSVEKTFRVLNYIDEQKIKFATYLFEGSACHWWAIIERKWERNGVENSWEQFREEFLRKFIPQVVKDLREKEFMRLIQGSLTVAKYEAEFNRLIQYAPHVMADEERKRKKFIEGLRLELRRAVAINRPQDYDSAVETAMELEAEFQELHKISDKKKGKWTGKFDNEKGKKGNFNKRPKIGNTSTPTDRGKAPMTQGKTTCGYCGGTSHSEDQCWKKLGKCFVCGSDQHTIKDCPKNRKGGNVGTQNQQQGVAGRPQIKARAYALTGEEGTDPTQVVEGKVLIQKFIYKALFDPGATHSFISLDCAKKLDLPHENMDISYEIHTPVGDCYETRIRYPRCPVVIENQNLSADLIELPIQDYDLILGMDWLFQHRAIVDCRAKTVQLGTGVEISTKSENKNGGTPIISAVRARKIMKKGGQGFMAYLINKPQDKTELKDVEVINEFPEVFPEELNSLPPDREIEFVIETIPGVMPFSKTPYRMTPAELKELKE